LVSDVPLGAFLSGGIDSSLIVRYMSEAGAKPLRTFNVAFARRVSTKPRMRKPSRVHSAPSTRSSTRPQWTARLLETAIGELDQPLADPAYLATKYSRA
jgi:asparagine synthase (glutamine-hydrolysing)